MGSGVRRLFLDEGPGETRACVFLDGRPERLLLRRANDGDRPRLGERHVARLRGLAPDRTRGYLALANGREGVAALGAPPPLGAALEVEVVAEAYADKGPRLRAVGPAEGPPRRLKVAPSPGDRLAAWAPGVPVERGVAAEAACDLAQEAALATIHPLGRGLTLHVEPTRALTAVDVDLAEGARGRRAAEVNLRAVRHAVRLLRLKGLGGVAVVDLAGAPKGGRYVEEALAACAPDGEGCVALAPDRLGLLRLARPHTLPPVHEILLEPDGRPSAATCAAALARALRREAAANPGAPVEAVCAPDVAAELTPLASAMGPRFRVRADRACDRASGHVSVL